MIEILNSFEPFILTLHFVVCIFMTVVILLQAGKGASMGATFGAGSSQTLFGARGAATFLSKITTTGAVFFLLTSISLAAIHKNRSTLGSTKSAIEEVTAEEVPDTIPLQIPLEEEPTP